MQSLRVERITIAVCGLAEDGERATAVEQLLSGVMGVSRVYANAATEMVYIEYDPTRITRGMLCGAIESAGLQTGELEVISVGSTPEPGLHAQDPTALSGLRYGSPAILTDPPQGGQLRTSAMHEVSAQRSEGSTPYRRPGVSRYAPGSIVPLLRGHLARILSAAGLALILASLTWLFAVGHPAEGNAVTVEAGSGGFKPLALVIPAGKSATLIVRNSDPAPGHVDGTVTPRVHQFAIPELGINVKLQPGQSMEIPLPPLQPATYHYYCGVCCGGGGGGGSDPNMQGALIIH